MERSSPCSGRSNSSRNFPSKRVDALVSGGDGKHFDPGQGRVMKKCVVVQGKGDWVELAKEAYDFVKRGKW